MRAAPAAPYTVTVNLYDELKRIESLEWPLHKKVGAFYSASVTIAKFAEEMIIPVLRGQLDLKVREQAVTGTYYRMYAWMKTLGVLNGPIYHQAVAAGARTLFELMLDLKILAEDTTGDDIKKFLAFPEIEKYRVAKKLTEFREANPALSDVDTGPMRAFLDVPERAADVVLLQTTYYGTDRNAKPIKPSHWTGKKADQRAREAGKQYESWYVELWSLLSWHMHSGSVGYQGLSEDGMHSLFGLAHRHAQIFFLNGTVLCAEAMKLRPAIESFSAFIDRLERMPGEVIVREQLDFIRKQAEKPSDGSG